MAELSKAGRSIGATMSSHTGRPMASSSGWSYGESGLIASTTRAICSSTVLSRSVGMRLSGMVRTLAVAGHPSVEPASTQLGFPESSRCARPTTVTSPANFQSPFTTSSSARLKRPPPLPPELPRPPHRRHALGEPPVELLDQLVVMRVEIHVRHAPNTVLGDQLVAVPQSVAVRAQHQQVVGGLHRKEPLTADLDQRGAVEDLDRCAHRSLDLDHLRRRGVRRVDGLDVLDQCQPEDSVAGRELLANRT